MDLKLFALATCLLIGGACAQDNLDYNSLYTGLNDSEVGSDPNFVSPDFFLTIFGSSVIAIQPKGFRLQALGFSQGFVLAHFIAATQVELAELAALHPVAHPSKVFSDLSFLGGLNQGLLAHAQILQTGLFLEPLGYLPEPPGLRGLLFGQDLGICNRCQGTGFSS